MKALLCENNGVVLQDDYPKPLANGETLIKVRMAGICRTDLELSRGYMGYSGILGHEFIGKVAGADSRVPVGQRVVGEINAGCGGCADCRRGLRRHCLNRSVLGILNRGGCMAEWTALPDENLLAVSDSVSDQAAVFTEPLAAALEIFEQIQIRPADRAAIIGDGKLGLLIAMAFSATHPGETTIIGHHQSKLQTVKGLARTRLEKEINAADWKKWDIIVEATGSTLGLRLAINLVRPRGTIVLKSTMAHAEPIDLTPIVIDEINLIGSRCGQFAPALRLLEKQAVPVERLIDAEFPIHEALAAWSQAQSKGAKKVLLRIA